MKLFLVSRLSAQVQRKINAFQLLTETSRSLSSLTAYPKRRFKVLEGKVFLDDESQRKSLLEKASANEQEYLKRIDQVKNASSSSAIQRHTVKNNKILVRDRLKLLVDDDFPMIELGLFTGMGMFYGDVPCAGTVCVIAKISGQLCVVGANDATIKGGSVFPIGVKKTLRAHEIAMENNLPFLHYVDSGGGFLPLQAEFFADKEHGGRSFYNEAIMNAAGLPQICIVAGSCTAGAAYIPTMSNEVVMVDKIGSIFLAGPPLVYAAIGEKISEQNLGGATVHCDISGVADYKAKNELDAIETTKDVMSTLNMDVYLDEHRAVEQPFYSADDLPLLSVKRDEHGRLDISKILARLLDGSRFHEFKPTFGLEIISGFGRMDGILVGIVANYGQLSTNACIKATNFISICSQRGIPILFLQDIIGQQNDVMMIKNIAQLMSAVAVSSVPKITLILGKSYGIGNYAMCGRSMSPQFLYLWPTAEVAIENTDLIESNDISEYGDIEKEKSCYYSSNHGWDDGVVLPQETRDLLRSSLSVCLTHKPVEKESLTNVMRM